LRACLIGSYIFIPACKPATDLSQSDPIEPFNRKVFTFNDALDQTILRPAALAYKETVPKLLRQDIANFLRWLDTPSILANNLMQGDLQQATKTLKGFVLQSVSLGSIDPELDYGLSYRDEDFGQTLGVYGVEGGAYLVLPLLGPTNLRDTVGRTVDVFLNPLTYIGPESGRTIFKLTKGSLEALTFRAGYFNEIDELRADSIDYYARVRTIYGQKRRAAINNGKIPRNLPPADSIDAFDGQFLKLLKNVK